MHRALKVSTLQWFKSMSATVSPAPHFSRRATVTPTTRRQSGPGVFSDTASLSPRATTSAEEKSREISIANLTAYVERAVRSLTSRIDELKTALEEQVAEQLSQKGLLRDVAGRYEQLSESQAVAVRNQEALARSSDRALRALSEEVRAAQAAATEDHLASMRALSEEVAEAIRWQGVAVLRGQEARSNKEAALRSEDREERRVSQRAEEAHEILEMPDTPRCELAAPCEVHAGSPLGSPLGDGHLLTARLASRPLRRHTATKAAGE